MYDWDRLGKNEVIGSVSVSVASLIHPTDKASGTVSHLAEIASAIMMLGMMMKVVVPLQW